MTSRFILTTLAAGALVAISACSGGQSSGTPRPETNTQAATTTTSASTTPSANDGSLKDKDPCSLLSSTEASGLGATGTPKREMVGTKDTCKWKSADSNFHVGIRTNLGLAQVQADGGKLTEITVGGRPAKQVSEDTAGTCIIALEVTSSSRVDVTVTPPPKSDGCPLALKVAEFVAPKLP
ncbi:DUF3558 family protein [Lentzea atacamensis]|nr:DUF3558 family protein [Lentzea atacamensis]